MARLRCAGFCLLLLFSMSMLPSQAQEASKSINIGYVELQEDARYRADSAYAGIEFRTLGRPFPGAQLGLEDARTIGRVTEREFTLQHERADSVEALANRVKRWSSERNIHFVLTDLPAETLLELADASDDLPILFINISAPDDSLRQEQCRDNIAHTYPSHSMLSDALMQYLSAQGWKELLVLSGETETDMQTINALRRSAQKFGAEIVDERRFVLSNSPRERDRNNITLLSDDIDYDVTFVADASGELGRYIPYQTRLPRPVVGSAGLTPRAWHWSWHRHGAAQLQHRFEALAPPRRMNSQAWAAWVAVKAITQAALRGDSSNYEDMRRFMLGDDLNLDSVKGNPASFRAWNHQLKQPLLLTTANAVIARLPLPESLHRFDVLDTLGFDEPETQCSFVKKR